MRRDLTETGAVKHLQVVLPKNLKAPLKETPLRKYGTCPRNSKKIEREYYIAALAWRLGNWIAERKQGFQNKKRMDTRRLRPLSCGSSGSAMVPADAIDKEIIPILTTQGIQKVHYTKRHLLRNFPHFQSFTVTRTVTRCVSCINWTNTHDCRPRSTNQPDNAKDTTKS